MPAKKTTKSQNGNGGVLGIESQLWLSADKMRGHLDAAEYENVVLGLIFLKYISDAFEQLHTHLVANQGGEGIRKDRRWQYDLSLMDDRPSIRIRFFWNTSEAGNKADYA